MHLLIRPFRAVIGGTHWRRASDSAALSGCWPRLRDRWVAVACQKPSLLFKPPPQSHQWGRDREGSWFSRAPLDTGLLIPFSWCLCRALLSSGSEWESEAFIPTSTTGAGRVTVTLFLCPAPRGLFAGLGGRWHWRFMSVCWGSKKGRPAFLGTSSL